MKEADNQGQDCLQRLKEEQDGNYEVTKKVEDKYSYVLAKIEVKQIAYFWSDYNVHFFLSKQKKARKNLKTNLTL